MPFTRPTFAQIRARVKTDIQGALEGTAAFFRRSTERAAGEAVTGTSHHLHGHLDWVTLQLDPRTADDVNVEKIHGEPYGVFRNAAVNAQLTLDVTGTNGTIIPDTTVWVRADGARYTVDVDGTIAAGVATLAITAEVADGDSNCDDGTELLIDAPIAGLDNDGVVASTTVTGSDQETIDAYLDRVLSRRQDPVEGGAKGDFRDWVMETGGITRAWEFDTTPGPGLVTVFAVNDAGTPITLTAAKITEVLTYVDQPGRKPATSTLLLPLPTLYEIDPAIQLSPNTPTVQAAVTAALEAHILTVATPAGMTLLWSQLNEAISSAAGEIDHNLTSPGDDVVIPYGSLIVLGTPVYSAMT